MITYLRIVPLVHAKLQLTVWRIQIPLVFPTPPHWSNVRTIVTTPVVIGIVPLIKMNEKVVANHICHRSNADKVWVHAIDCFYLHSSLKAMFGGGNLWENKCTHLERFSIVSKVISEVLWFCVTSPNDWFKVLVPLFQPIRSKTKSNRGSRVHIFPRFVSASYNYFDF